MPRACCRDIEFPNVRTSSVESVWYDSDGFNHFRGDSWMKEPCRSCPEKHKDFGGCRCQAYMLTGMPPTPIPSAICRRIIIWSPKPSRVPIRCPGSRKSR